MNKIGRNDHCPCGSGKKYKKCCINVDQSNFVSSVDKTEKFLLTQPSTIKANERALIVTTTNEPFMFIRLYYDIYNKEDLIRNLSKMRCIDWAGSDEFLLNYIYETENIGLAVKHNKVPKDLRPIILAKGKITNEDILVLDLRSYERGWRIIKFIDKHIDRDIIKVTHMAIYNKMHDTTKESPSSLMNTNYDQLFSNDNIHYPENDMDDIMQDVEKIKDLEERKKFLVDFIEKSTNKEPALIEMIPVHFYEDGLNSIKCTLNFHQRLAHEHFMGNTSLNMHQLIKQLIDRNPML